MKGLSAQEGGVHAAVEGPGLVTPLGSVSTHEAAAVIPRNVSFWPFGLGQKVEGAPAVPSPGTGRSPALPCLALQSP